MDVLVSVKEGYEFPDVAKALRDAGMSIERELDEIGIITGRIESEKVELLRDMNGVLDVEEDRDVSAFTAK